MKKAEMVLANFDARIPKIVIKPQNLVSKVIITSMVYDETTNAEISVKIIFENVVAIDFRINLFDCMIGSEAYGLYRISDQAFVESVTRIIFDRRREIFLLEGDYDYVEEEQHDMLNSYDICGEFRKHIEEYSAYIQNVEAGAYIIIAKDVRIER